MPVSIIGTFGAMYLLGFSLDNLSLMALTVSTGFVVDDAIVVLENISRHLEAGMPRLQAALIGAREVGFTVLSMSLSLVAVFLPILLMGGIVGRLFREFAMTLSLAILVSLAISLTTTPMMCALFLRPRAAAARGRGRAPCSTARWRCTSGRWHGRCATAALVMLVLLVTIGLNVALFVIIPKGFFPQQDTGRLMGGMQADQSISFQAMEQKLTQMMDIVQRDPAVQSVVGFTGQGAAVRRPANTGRVFVALKPLSERASVAVVMCAAAPRAVGGARRAVVSACRSRTSASAAARAMPHTSTHCRPTDSASLLYEWTPKLLALLEKSPVLRDVNSDQQQKGLETDLHIDRATASRLGINATPDRQHAV